MNFKIFLMFKLWDGKLLLNDLILVILIFYLFFKLNVLKFIK